MVSWVPNNLKHTWAIIAGDMFNRPYGTRVSATHYTGNKLPAYYQISLTGFWLNSYEICNLKSEMSISLNYPLFLLLFALLVFLLVYLSRKNQGGKRFWQLGLRLLIGAILLLSLAGLSINLRNGGTDVLFLLDVSASIPSHDKARSSELIRKWTKRMGAQDRAGLILFAREALVERSLGPDLSLAGFRSQPDPSDTDIAAALKLSMVLASDALSPRVVLMSDGISTSERTISSVLESARSGIPIHVFPLGLEEEEAYISSVQIPERVRASEPFSVKIFLKSKSGTRTKVLWSVQEELRKVEEVFIPGEEGTMVTLDERLEENHLYEYQVKILPEKDNRTDNNQISGRLKVSSRPEILYISPRSGEQTFAQALKSTPFHVTYRNDKNAIDETLGDLRRYDLVIMDNLKVWEISPAFLERIRESVIRDGTGLLIAGNIDTFSSVESQKTPLEEILPVIPGLSERKQKPSLSLVILLDKSGSMEGGEKILYAARAASRAVQLLDHEDYIGIIAFDVEAIPLLPPTKKSELVDLDGKLGRLSPSGGTDLIPALNLAKDWLQPATTQQKLILILSDGQVGEKGSELLRSPLLPDVRISTVGIEPEADRQFLTAMAEKNSGKSYFAKAGEEIPTFFAQEVVRLTRQKVLPEAIKPKVRESHPILKGIMGKDIPALGGYVTTGLKKNALMLMEINEGDPLLAIWQVGLGRSAVLTTDLHQWGPAWFRWEGFPQIFTQLVRWLIKKGEYLEESNARDELAAVKEEIPKELRDFGADLNMLERIAALTGGRILEEGDNPFDHTTGKRSQVLDLATPLLILALVLFLVEMLLRKVLF